MTPPPRTNANDNQSTIANLPQTQQRQPWKKRKLNNIMVNEMSAEELFVYSKSWEVLGGTEIDMAVASAIMTAISLTDQMSLITAPPVYLNGFVNALKGKYIQKPNEENGGKEEKKGKYIPKPKEESGVKEEK